MFATAKTQRFEYPIVSRFTIAILSGILIGLSFGKMMPREFAALVEVAGVVAFIYFLNDVLNEARRQRRQTDEARASIELRLQEHVIFATQVTSQPQEANQSANTHLKQVTSAETTSGELPHLRLNITA